MTHSVFHRRYGIELNLSEDDLGHPDRPGLLDELYGNYHPDVLYCVEAYEHDGAACPGFMAIRMRNGRPHAMHVSKGECKESRNESDLHKALKEYTAVAAGREGFSVQVEDRAAHGKRRTDVIVKSDSGEKIGYEIQLSAIASGSVDYRTRIAKDDGLTPLWLVNDENAIPIDRAPWARLNVHSWRQVGREALPVRGGVKELRMSSCDWSTPTPCPRTGRGRCGGRHGRWEPKLGLYYDDVIAKTASGELVPFYYERSDGRRGWHMWVTPADKEEYLQGRPELIPAQGERKSDREELPLVPQQRDPYCHYREDSGIRSELSRPRDSGDPIDVWDGPASPAPRAVASVVSVDGYVVPGELIVLYREFVKVEAICDQIAATLPSGMDIVSGRASAPSEVRAWLAEAREHRLCVVEELNDHPWWSSVENRHRAREALRYAERTTAHDRS